MITLHILQWLEDNDLGTIDTDLFWEQTPLDAKGVTIISRGGELQRNRRAVQSFDLYARDTNNLAGADRLEKIWEFISDNGVACTLPETEKSTKTYQRCRILPESNLENLGLDETDRLLWRWSYNVSYIK